MNNGSTIAATIKIETKDNRQPHTSQKRNGHHPSGHILADHLFTEHGNRINGTALKNPVGVIHEYAAHYQQKIDRHLAASDMPETDRTAAEAIQFFKAGYYIK